MISNGVKKNEQEQGDEPEEGLNKLQEVIKSVKEEFPKKLEELEEHIKFLTKKIGESYSDEKKYDSLGYLMPQAGAALKISADFFTNNPNDLKGITSIKLDLLEYVVNYLCIHQKNLSVDEKRKFIRGDLLPFVNVVIRNLQFPLTAKDAFKLFHIYKPIEDAIIGLSKDQTEEEKKKDNETYQDCVEYGMRLALFNKDLEILDMQAAICLHGKAGNFISPEDLKKPFEKTVENKCKIYELIRQAFDNPLGEIPILIRNLVFSESELSKWLFLPLWKDFLMSYLKDYDTDASKKDCPVYYGYSIRYSLGLQMLRTTWSLCFSDLRAIAQSLNLGVERLWGLHDQDALHALRLMAEWWQEYGECCEKESEEAKKELERTKQEAELHKRELDEIKKQLEERNKKPSTVDKNIQTAAELPFFKTEINPKEKQGDLSVEHNVPLPSPCSIL